MNFEISKEPINTQAVIDKVVQREAGAITTFIGTVRELTHGKKTLYLIYEAYEAMAVKKLEQIGREIQEKWPDAQVAITHRVGRLDITDIAVVIAVSTPHRADSYEANRYAIERIKEDCSDLEKGTLGRWPGMGWRSTRDSGLSKRKTRGR